MIEIEFASIFFQKIAGPIRFMQTAGHHNQRVRR